MFAEQEENFSKEQDELFFYLKHMCAGRDGGPNKEKTAMQAWMVLYPNTKGIDRREKCLVSIM